ncbi:MAG: EpsI family protein [Acidobacteria bacterium]|nr:EpsI family protein [Acidobacteriota bacterium]
MLTKIKNNMSYLAMLLILIAAAVLAHYLSGERDQKRMTGRVMLSEFPNHFDRWKQTSARTLGSGQERELGADDYLSRTYTDDHGTIAYLFIAYYGSQRPRQTFHSPQNCIPGAGWTMSNHRLHRFDQDQKGRERAINEYLIEKDDEQMLAFYWYHGRGRVVANEYWARLAAIEDSLLIGRTDGAMIRLIVPLERKGEGEEQVRKTGLDFARQLLAIVGNYIPN